MIKLESREALRRFNPEAAAFVVLDMLPVTEQLKPEHELRRRVMIAIIQANKGFRHEYLAAALDFYPNGNGGKWYEWTGELSRLVFGHPETLTLREIDTGLNIYSVSLSRVVPVVIDRGEDENLIHQIKDPEECVLFERPAFTVLTRTEPTEKTSGTQIKLEIAPNYPLRELIKAAQMAFVKDLDHETGERIEKELKEALGLTRGTLYGLQETEKGTYILDIRFIRFRPPSWTGE